MFKNKHLKKVNMKKLLYAALCCAIVLCSCEQTNEGKKLTPEESKDKFEMTAKAFMDACPASDFDDLADFATFLNKNYFSSEANYDFSALSEKYDEYSESSCQENGSIFGIAFVLSKYTGEFTFASNGLTYKDSKGLSFNVTDDKNNKWVLALETSGEVREFINKDIDGTELIVKIPENVIVILTRNGEQMLKETVTYNINLSANIDVSKDKVSVSQEFAIKDYVIKLTNEVNGKSGELQASASLTKNGKLLAQGSVKGSIAMAGDNISSITFNNATNVTIDADIMEGVQLKGSVKNALDISNACDYSPRDKEEVIAARNIVNSLFDLKFYYDNTSTEQGYFELEEQEYKDYEGTSCWELYPVIVFNDDSRYFVEDYFNEDDFKNLIKNFDAFVELYEALIEKVVE